MLLTQFEDVEGSDYSGQLLHLDHGTIFNLLGTQSTSTNSLKHQQLDQSPGTSSEALRETPRNKLYCIITLGFPMVGFVYFHVIYFAAHTNYRPFIRF